MVSSGGRRTVKDAEIRLIRKERAIEALDVGEFIFLVPFLFVGNGFPP